MSHLSSQTCKTQALRLAGLALAGAILLSPNVGFAQNDKAVLKAYESKAEDDSSFDTMFKFIGSSDSEEKWLQIGWIPGLWSGVEIASEKKKPVFIWAMNGDPLGCV